MIGHKRENAETDAGERERKDERERKGGTPRKVARKETENAAPGFATLSPPNRHFQLPTLFRQVAHLFRQPCRAPSPLCTLTWDLDVCNSILLGTSTFSPFSNLDCCNSIFLGTSTFSFWDLDCCNPIFLGTSIVVTRSFWGPRLNHQLLSLSFPHPLAQPHFGTSTESDSSSCIATFGHLDWRLVGTSTGSGDFFDPQESPKTRRIS